jgi:hypothetical protein
VKDWRRVTICLKEEEYLELRKQSGASGVSMSVFIREMIKITLDVEQEEEWVTIER